VTRLGSGFFTQYVEQLHQKFRIADRNDSIARLLLLLLLLMTSELLRVEMLPPQFSTSRLRCHRLVDAGPRFEFVTVFWRRHRPQSYATIRSTSVASTPDFDRRLACKSARTC
jgi:hypothetical protein